VNDEEAKAEYEESWTSFKKMLVTRCFMRLHFGICAILIPIFIADHYPDLPVTLTAWILSVPALTQLGAVPFAGQYAVYLGHKNSVVLSAIML